MIFILEIKLQMHIFWQNMSIFQGVICPFWTTVSMGLCIRTPQRKNWKEKHLQ